MSDERAGGVAFMQTAMKRNNLGELLAMIGTSEEPSGFEAALGDDTARKAIGWLMPHGWLYFEMLNHSLLMDDMIANGWDASAKVFHPQTLDANERAFTKQLRNGLSRCAFAPSNAFPSPVAGVDQSFRKILARAGHGEPGRAGVRAGALSQNTSHLPGIARGPRAGLSRATFRTKRFRPMPCDTAAPAMATFSIPSAGMEWMMVGALLNKKSEPAEKGDWVWRMGR